MKIEIKSDLDKLVPKFKQMEKNVQRATASAMNKTALQARTQAKNILTKEYTLTSSDTLRILSVIKATAGNLKAFLVAKSQQLGFSNESSRIKSAKWKARQYKRKGTVIEIKKKQKSSFKHAFIAKMPSGHIGVFERTGDKREMTKGRFKGQKRQGIKEIVGPSAAYLFGSEGIMTRLNTFIKDKFPEIFKHEFDYFNK